MEDIAPPLALLQEVRFALENGEPIRQGIRKYIRRCDDPFAQLVQSWLFCFDQGQIFSEAQLKKQSSYRRALLETLRFGLQGHPIRAQLDELEREIQDACENEIDEFMNMLPLKMLIPLVVFQFPAFLLLLVGPLLMQIIKELSR